MAGAGAITIGAFDGVHLGHQALIRAARSAVGDGGRVLVLAFEPHPLRMIRPREVPGRLSSFPQRRRWLMEAGADDVVALEPTTEFLSRSPRDFLDWLCAEHAPGVIVEGADFRFGRDRAGSVETLRQHERIYGYRTVVVGDVEAALGDHSLVRVASSLIRWLVGHGRVRDAALLLGRPYELECEVVHGDGRPEAGQTSADNENVMMQEFGHVTLGSSVDGLRGRGHEFWVHDHVDDRRSA